MLKKVLILILLFIPFISAVCESGQIDVNSASKDELMNIIGLGGKGIVAQNVIDYREENGNFNSLDDLVDVNRIGNITLEKIKNQGLACVSEEQIVQKTEIVEEEEKSVEEDEEVVEIPEIKTIQKDKTTIKIENEIIDLSPQNIKSEDYNENKSKSDYAKYGLGLFCVLLFGLFMIKKYKPRKNEFR
ncbi:MAG: helix-hairpin-helix domain-containing protein [Nanoarchaeota archaeon]